RSGHTLNLSPLEAHGADVRLQESGDEIEERALAGAVWTDHAQDLAAVHLGTVILERGQPAEGLGETASYQNGHRFRRDSRRLHAVLSPECHPGAKRRRCCQPVCEPVFHGLARWRKRSRPTHQRPWLKVVRGFVFSISYCNFRVNFVMVVREQGSKARRIEV